PAPARRGREMLARSFAALAASIEDARLAAELRTDVVGIVDKIRSWDPSPAGAEEPGELDASAEVLAAEPPSPLPVGAAASSSIALDADNELTRKYIHLYTATRKRGVEETLARSGRYRELIERELEKAGLPRELFYLVMTESEYKLFARSHSGAAGLWQFMPFTARKYGLEVSFWIDERYDPEKATGAAIRYLSDLHRWFGDWHLAMAAYNRGENGLGRDLIATRSMDFATTSRRGAMPNETRHYVPKFMACAFIGMDPGKYGLEPRYEEPLAYDEVALERDLSLEVAAKAAGVGLEAIQRLNPQVRNWATPPKRPGFLFRVPKGSKDSFLASLAGVADWNPGPSLVRYTIRKGDVLGKIANRHRTTVKAITALNNIRNPRLLRPGMVLKLKPGRGYQP
ncbi:MAG: transglycosylase SLT domain-containing protein, partial [Elusimicrobia bacterium]|nr:transglycosylase SLT domain-containing protein [Elusimicrobiota bacterium]